MKRPGFKRIHAIVEVNGKIFRHDFKAGPKNFFDADKNVDGAIDTIALHLEEKFPGKDFRFVQTEPNIIKFIEVAKPCDTLPHEEDRQQGEGLAAGSAEQPL